jgi:hypothetical protein
MLRGFTLIQYEAYLRCWGIFDAELEDEMVDTLQAMGTVPRIISGRIVCGRVLEQPIPGLEIYFVDATKIFSIWLALHSRLGQMLLRRLAIADSKCTLKIEFWDCDGDGNQLPDRYVSVRQRGLLLFDPYVATASAFAAPECNVDDGVSVERVLLQAEAEFTLAWHIELANRLVAVWYGMDRSQLLRGSFSPSNNDVKPVPGQVMDQVWSAPAKLLEDES